MKAHNDEEKTHGSCASLVSYEEFSKIDLRSGTIVKAENFLKARKPAYKVWVDFGERIGVKQTSAQITQNYTPDQLIDQKVIGVLNLGEKNIGGFISQFLLVGFDDENGNVSLASFSGTVPNGKKLY